MTNLRTMPDEDLCRLAHATGKTAASPIIGELVKRLEESMDREEDLQKQIPPQETAPCQVCGAKL